MSHSALPPADPIFDAMARQQAAWDALEPYDCFSPEWKEVDEAEWAAWREMINCRPTTLKGVASLAQRVAENPETLLRDEEGAPEVLRSIAEAVLAIMNQRNEQLDLLRGLEPHICDTVNMIDIACDLQTDFLRDCVKGLYGEAGKKISLNDYSVGKLAFATSHASTLATALRKRFYAAVKGEEVP